MAELPKGQYLRIEVPEHIIREAFNRSQVPGMIQTGQLRPRYMRNPTWSTRRKGANPIARTAR